MIQNKEIKRFINNKNIKNEIYKSPQMKEYGFHDGVNTILVKAGMGMGKTKMLKNLFKDYEDKKIIIISFRKTLDKEYVNNFEGFTLYEDIKMQNYDTDIYNKIVIQIDSLYKLRGSVDLIVLDEFSYTSMHLITSVRHKEGVYNTLYEYISEKNHKVIVMDALLDLKILKWFYYERKHIYYMENEYEKHKDKIIYKYNNKVGVFIKSLMNNLKNNKKIILATNSKNFLNTLEINMRKYPEIKYKFLNKDNSDDINLDNWNEYNIVGYTPTIVAGISYEKMHFDKCYGYFINSSAPAEMALQQLFRVRNLEDKEIHLCVENKGTTKHPVNIDDLKKNIINKSNCLVDGILGIKLSRVNRTIVEDGYFHLYKNVKLNINESKNDYDKRLTDLLKSQGIKNIKNIKENDEEEDKKVRKDMRETSKNMNDNQIEDIIKSDEIDDEEFNNLKNKVNLTYEDKCKIKKKTFRNVYNFDEEITKEDYKKYSGKYKQYNNIKVYYTFKDELTKYLQYKIQYIEDEKIRKNKEYEEGDTEGKRYSPNTYILHSNKSYEKYILGVEMLMITGKKDILDKNKFNIDFNKIRNYINNKENIIRSLFECNEININQIPNDKKGNKEILKYINTKLRSLFNIYIKEDKNTDEYYISNIDFWDDKFSPFIVDEDLIFELKMGQVFQELKLDTDFQ